MHGSTRDYTNLGKFGPNNMNCPRKSAFFAAVATFCFFAAPLLGQTPPPAKPPAPAAQDSQAPAKPQAPPTIRVITETVVVPVTVKDRTGNLVPDLRKDEFRIFEDNIEQEIRKLSVETVPLSLIILIDNDLKRKDEQQVEPSLVSIVSGLSTSDEAFICRFDQFFHEGKGFTRDQDNLLTQLKRTDLSSEPSVAPPGGPFNGPTVSGIPAPGAPPNPAGLQAIKGQPTKALDDAVFEAADRLRDRDGRNRRKVILLISDGQNGAKFNTHSYDETKAELLRQGITVYSVATGSSYFERRFNRLVSYSHDTGGDIYYGVKQNAFSEFYTRITEEARNQYTLTYSPRGERPVDYHSIEVRVRRDGLTILARQGYYGGTFTESPK
ncbi:MAG TPA: VWA domain-containing protein [Candidatus Acidoferrum sp.]|nr:VWA domain-containing protein [Candidatus Acidoferrum sp.]